MEKSFLNDDRVPRIFLHSFPNVPFVTWIQVKIMRFLSNITGDIKQGLRHFKINENKQIPCYRSSTHPGQLISVKVTYFGAVNSCNKCGKSPAANQ